MTINLRAPRGDGAATSISVCRKDSRGFKSAGCIAIKSRRSRARLGELLRGLVSLPIPVRGSSRQRCVAAPIAAPLISCGPSLLFLALIMCFGGLGVSNHWWRCGHSWRGRSASASSERLALRCLALIFLEAKVGLDS